MHMEKFKICNTLWKLRSKLKMNNNNTEKLIEVMKHIFANLNKLFTIHFYIFIIPLIFPHISLTISSNFYNSTAEGHCFYLSHRQYICQLIKFT